jgi:hypothetical protein
MKRLLLYNKVESNGSGNFSVRMIIRPLILILLLSGLIATAGSPPPIIPKLSVRFTKPVFECPTKNYCLDVEFLSDTPDQVIYGVNVRFFYDDAILEYLGMDDFHPNYEGVTNEVFQFPAGSGTDFGFGGALEWVNGTVQLVSNNVPLIVSTDNANWTRLFRVCFHVDDPNSLGIFSFCPSIAWDRLLNPPPPEQGTAGLLPGDDGVVVTLVDPTYQQDSSPTDEIVVQFNWAYDVTEVTVGYPVKETCIPTECGTPLPLSNWALFLGIGLMFVVSIFIYRKRISG